MGKRSSYVRNPHDAYPTPAEAVEPLLPHLRPGTRYWEPCAGAGKLVVHLRTAGHICVRATDMIGGVDARRLRLDEPVDCFITNPPWSREILHPIIENLAKQAPTWLLIDADWMHTRQAAPFMPLLRAIVSIGRVRWIPDSAFTGKDNCCWYLFGAADPLEAATYFYGRQA